VKKQNTIKLNGKLYDAITGKPVSGGSSTSEHHPGHVIRPTKHHAHALPAPQEHPMAKEVTEQTHRKAHKPHDTHRRTQRSRILMRHAVQKPPTIDKSHRIKDLHSVAPASHNIEQANSFSIMDLRHNRSHRAQSVHKSHLVHRFASHRSYEPSIIKKVANLSVRPAPQELVIKEHSSAPLLEPSTTDLFSSALATATSHQQTHSKHSRRHRAAHKLGVKVSSIHFGIAVLTVMVLGGFIIYQNAASIGVQLAAAKVGVRASMPGYRPAGFAMAHTIRSTPGQIVLNFHSTSDDRNFKITQTAISGGTQTSTLAANTGQSYQSISGPDGTTIYMYGSSNASWIKNGTLYSIEGNSSLSSVQLLKIASSF